MTARPPDVPSIDGISDKLTAFLRSVNAYIMREFSSRSIDNTARAGIYLQAPGGKVYQVTVKDDGTLETTNIKLGGGA